ncbi:MAG: hypothetical protein P4M00_23970 [Azospirillaceae bacterium]|nr:hypothetical protein [Azospirillaceae bacterium]
MKSCERLRDIPAAIPAPRVPFASRSEKALHRHDGPFPVAAQHRCLVTVKMKSKPRLVEPIALVRDVGKDAINQHTA